MCTESGSFCNMDQHILQCQYRVESCRETKHSAGEGEQTLSDQPAGCSSRRKPDEIYVGSGELERAKALDGELEVEKNVPYLCILSEENASQVACTGGMKQVER